MGSDKYEKQAGKSSKPNNPSRVVPKGSLYAYHPTKAHIEVLREGYGDWNTNWGVVAEYLLSGCRVSIGCTQGTDNFYLILKERADDWTTARGVSVFHNDMEKAVMALAYYLREVNPEFPNLTNHLVQQDFGF